MNTEIDPNTTQYNTCILVKHIRSWQPRPYADSVYESEITFTGKNISTNPDKPIVCGGNLSPDLAKAYVKLLVRNYSGETEGMMPYLASFSEIHKDATSITYRAVVREPYTD